MTSNSAFSEATAISKVCALSTVLGSCGHRPLKRKYHPWYRHAARLPKQKTSQPKGGGGKKTRGVTRD